MRPILLTATLLAIVSGASATGSVTPLPPQPSLRTPSAPLESASAIVPASMSIPEMPTDESVPIDTITQPHVAAMLPTTTTMPPEPATATPRTEAATVVASSVPPTGAATSQAMGTKPTSPAGPVVMPEAIATSKASTRPTESTASSGSSIAAASTAGQPPRNALRAIPPLEVEEDTGEVVETTDNAEEQALITPADATTSSGSSAGASKTSSTTRASSSVSQTTESGSGSVATESPSTGSKRKSSLKDDKSKEKDDDEDEGSNAVDPSLSNACVCKDVRKVSLMSASDYCLPSSAPIGNKCGNAAVGEKGECPRAGAQPCQDTGHVLSNHSVCAYDKRDETFKCVASKEDLHIQKYGKRRKKSGNSPTTVPSTRSAASARGHALSTMHTVLMVASLIVGIAAVM